MGCPRKSVRVTLYQNQQLEEETGAFPASAVEGARVQALVGELRPCMRRGQKNKKINSKILFSKNKWPSLPCGWRYFCFSKGLRAPLPPTFRSECLDSVCLPRTDDGTDALHVGKNKTRFFSAGWWLHILGLGGSQMGSRQSKQVRVEVCSWGPCSAGLCPVLRLRCLPTTWIVLGSETSSPRPLPFPP